MRCNSLCYYYSKMIVSIGSTFLSLSQILLIACSHTRTYTLSSLRSTSAILCCVYVHIYNIISAHKVAIKLCWVLVVLHFDLSESLQRAQLCACVCVCMSILLPLHCARQPLSWLAYFSTNFFHNRKWVFFCFSFLYISRAQSFDSQLAHALFHHFDIIFAEVLYIFSTHFISNVYTSYLRPKCLCAVMHFILLFICLSWSPAK